MRFFFILRVSVLMSLCMCLRACICVWLSVCACVYVRHCLVWFVRVSKHCYIPYVCACVCTLSVHLCKCICAREGKCKREGKVMSRVEVGVVDGSHMSC